jgi:2-succinyl-6-hydroxy-2,4-cyclohexadiene-1-carboxylate synthase
MPTSPHLQNILAFHGFFGTGEDWMFLQREFTERELKANWECPDLPGHGRSYDERPASIQSWLTLLNVKIQFPSILIGYSMGGRWAIEYALSFPEKVTALVLIGTHMEVPDFVQRAERIALDSRRANMLLKDGAAVFWENWKTNPLIATQPKHMNSFDFAQLEDRRKTQNPQGLAFALTAYGQGVWPERLNDLHKITCPVLILAGEKDPVQERVCKVVNYFKKATFSIVDAAGHAPQLENPAACADYLESLLKRVNKFENGSPSGHGSAS